MISAAADRFDVIERMITSLAQGDLFLDAPVLSDDPELEAIVLGLQMLAEELIASRAQLDRRAHELERSNAELDVLSRGFIRLSELSNLLLSCNSSAEAFSVVADSAREMYGGLSGGVYLTGPSRDLVDAVATWGDLAVVASFPPEDCWALRRGHSHLARASGPEPFCEHTRPDGPRTSLCIPMLAQGEAIGVLHLVGRPDVAARVLTTSAQRLAVAAAEECALALANVRLREKLAVQSVRDPLTGLYNRRFAEESITREIARAQREGKPLAFVILDLDGFKSFNDEYGHDGGDIALRAASTLFVESIRTSDMASRLGGDEFLLLLPGSSVEAAIAKCDVIRARLRLQEVHHRGRVLPSITLSGGAAGFPDHGSNAEALLRAADAALYEAKRAGRDRVTAAAPIRPPSRDIEFSEKAPE